MIDAHVCFVFNKVFNPLFVVFESILPVCAFGRGEWNNRKEEKKIFHQNYNRKSTKHNFFFFFLEEQKPKSKQNLCKDFKSSQEWIWKHSVMMIDKGRKLEQNKSVFSTWIKSHQQDLLVVGKL